MALLRRRSGAAAAATAEPATETAGADAPAATDQTDLPPSRMRGTEMLYGYVVGLELVVVAILNMVITKGKGAPAHPQTVLHVLGLVASLGFFALLQVRHRTIVGFGAIIAAFFVTTAQVPNSLGLARILGLAVPMGYALIITQRQRRATTAAMRGARSGRGAAGRSGASRADARAARVAERRRGAKAPAEAPSGPRPSARYTPPKPKRGKGRVSGR